MGIEILSSLLVGATSLAAGSSIVTGIVQNLISNCIGTLIGDKDEPEKPYSQRLSDLTDSLMKTSKRVDSILGELAQVARDREAAVQKLEVDLASLENREKEFKQRIDDLEKVPIPVAEHCAKLMESGEKRSAWRDYILFGVGVAISTAIAIGLKLVGLG